MNQEPPAGTCLPPHHHSGPILPEDTTPGGFFALLVYRVTRSLLRAVRSALRTDENARRSRRRSTVRRPSRPRTGSRPERSAASRAGRDRVPVDLRAHFRNQVVHLLAGLGGELPQLVDGREAAPDEPLR